MSLIFGLLGSLAALAGPDDFSMTIPVSPETPEGQRLIALRAVQICGSRYPRLTRYRFTGSEHASPAGARTSSFQVHQELTCTDTPPAAGTDTPAPSDWQASAQDEADVRAATMAYFGAVDAGDAARLHGMMSTERQADESLESRTEALRAFREEAGTPGTHRIVALTWYVNPQNAPRPGIYVAADFERAYSGLLINCGYLVWFREAGGRYTLVREENNVVARRNVSDATVDLAQLRAMTHCRAG
jgi:hypothetical protein